MQTELLAMTHTFTCPHCASSWHLTAEEVQSMHDCGVADLLVDEVLCDDCEAATAALEASQRAEDRRAAFLAGIPAEYRSASPERVPACFAQAKMARPLRMGLIGPSGSGKSCAMAVHVIARGSPFVWLTVNELREITIKAAVHGGEWSAKLNRACAVPVLVIDDISQARFTEAFASTFYELLEIRNKNRLVVLWTSQKPLDALRAKIAAQCGDSDQSEAISRRLGQDALQLTAG